ncbi:uncharacterized protein EMH_0047810 [Eimeria mitis]|uniref:Uncharacterized protein n=1 Tax=Eimeria mitis TaxID=44415 RepID=U6JYT1_9EIME|nr:uncharacterized protein EMH_0047810 [Eimeria mitis]CDJ29212.1 hypothetical protein EMH_0047810 [Eimeria mitis]
MRDKERQKETKGGRQRPAKTGEEEDRQMKTAREKETDEERDKKKDQATQKATRHLNFRLQLPYGVYTAVLSAPQHSRAAAAIAVAAETSRLTDSPSVLGFSANESGENTIGLK